MKARVMVNVLFIFAAFILFSAAGTRAEDAGITLKQDSTIRDVLTAQVGKRAAIRLDSNDEIEGTIVKVGDGLVHIAKLSGKDFYDSVVRIDRISAVRMRARER